jgi:DNA-binding SARP family transcriptional activator
LLSLLPRGNGDDGQQTRGCSSKDAWRLLGFYGVSGLEQDAWRLKNAAALVKLLARAPNHPHHREQVIYRLWPHLGKRAASSNLRRTLHATRRVLGPTEGSRYLVSKGEWLALCPERTLWVDVEAFEEASTTARREHDPAAYRAALDLYAGELLPTDRYEEWAEEKRDGLRRLHLDLLV